MEGATPSPRHGHRRDSMADGALPQVENAVLLRAFDYVAAAALGVVAASAAWALVPAPPHMLVEMLLGMVVGALSALPLLAVFSWILGGFEIVVLSMQVGMVAGMMGAMTTSSSLGEVAFEGLMAGLLVQFLIHAVDRSMEGEVPRDA